MTRAVISYAVFLLGLIVIALSFGINIMALLIGFDYVNEIRGIPSFLDLIYLGGAGLIFLSLRMFQREIFEILESKVGIIIAIVILTILLTLSCIGGRVAGNIAFDANVGGVCRSQGIVYEADESLGETQTPIILAYARRTNITKDVVIADEIRGKEVNYVFSLGRLSQITSLTLGTNIEYVHTDFINGCTSLESLIIKAVIPPRVVAEDRHIGNIPFDRHKKLDISPTLTLTCADNLKIYVPDQSVEAYKTADGWSAYADIIFPISALPD